MQSTGSRR